MKHLVLSLLLVYKKFASPVLESVFGKGCRFAPTCSEYAATAIEKHGLYKGGVFALRRFIRCQPFSLGHFDPVPEKITK